MNSTKMIVVAFVAVIIGVVVYSMSVDKKETVQPEAKAPPLKVQAIQIKETVMSDVMALQGALERRREFVAVLKGGAECAGKIKKGLEAMVRIEGVGTSYRSVVSVINASGSSYTVIVPLPQAPASLPNGATVMGTIYGTTSSSSLVVPWTAIDRRKGSCVWVVRPEKTAKRVDIKIGSYDDNMVAISGDIQNDQWVVLSPHDQLDEGRDLEVSEVY